MTENPDFPTVGEPTPEAPVRDGDDSQLVRALHGNRRAVLGKVSGLTLADATSLRLPSGVTLLGVVAHLTAVEREWFGHCYLGEPLEGYGEPDDSDVDTSFEIDPAWTIDDVVDDYRRACRRSAEAVAAAPSLDERTREPHWYFGIVTLRFVLQHVLTETARHAGHLDILRELTDGDVGDDRAPDDI
jgi:uncharacterized damage-inducible protein DinB